MNTRRLYLADETSTADLGARLAAVLDGRAAVIALQGDLGAGKTTLVRALLRSLGVGGAVRSPTYTLVEPYEVGAQRVFHLDLYRLADPEELEYLGIRDLDGALQLIEWPERGEGWLPPVDLWLHLAYAEGPGRIATLRPLTETGHALLAAMIWAEEDGGSADHTA